MKDFSVIESSKHEDYTVAWRYDTRAKHTHDNPIHTHRAFNQLLSVPKETTKDYQIAEKMLYNINMLI